MPISQPIVSVNAIYPEMILECLEGVACSVQASWWYHEHPSDDHQAHAKLQECSFVQAQLFHAWLSGEPLFCRVPGVRHLLFQRHHYLSPVGHGIQPHNTRPAVACSGDGQNLGISPVSCWSCLWLRSTSVCALPAFLLLRLCSCDAQGLRSFGMPPSTSTQHVLPSCNFQR